MSDKTTATTPLEFRRRMLQDRVTALRLTLRDYTRNRERILNELHKWENRLDRLDADYARATGGGIEEAQAEISKLDETIRKVRREPLVAKARALRLRLAEELGVSPAEVSEALDRTLANLIKEEDNG